MKKVVTIYCWLIFIIFIIYGCATDTANIKEKANLHYRLGTSYLSEGDVITALKELMEANRLNPNDHEINWALGEAFRARQMFNDAIGYFKKSISIKPDFSEAHNSLGVIYLQQDKWDPAIDEFQKALSNIIYATPGFALTNMGWAYYRKNMFQEAIKNLKRAIEINPQFYLAHHNLGIVYAEQGNYDEAIKAQRSALKIFPRYPDAYYHLGLVYSKQNEKKNAIDSFNEVIKISPNGPYANLAKEQIEKLSK